MTINDKKLVFATFLCFKVIKIDKHLRLFLLLMHLANTGDEVRGKK